MGVRFVVLADSKRAVASAFEGFTGGLGFRGARPPTATAWGSSCVASSRRLTIEVIEVDWLSRLRRGDHRGRGRLLEIRRDSDESCSAYDAIAAATPAAFGCAVSPRLTFLDDPRGAATPSEDGLLREFVLSSNGALASAAAALRRAALTHGAPSVAPDVLRVDALFDLRLQPLGETCAIVLRCDDLEAAHAALRLSGGDAQRIGRSGTDPGQLQVVMPWSRGLEIRLCQRLQPAALFHESHDSITDAPDVIPELQSSRVDPSDNTRDRLAPAKEDGGDCWMETRAMIKRPWGFFARR